MPVCGPTRAGPVDKRVPRIPRVCAVGVTGMAILVLLSGQAEPPKSRAPEALRQCWTPEALGGNPREKRIEQNIERAYKRLPAGQPRATRLPEQWRRADPRDRPPPRRF